MIDFKYNDGLITVRSLLIEGATFEVAMHEVIIIWLDEKSKVLSLYFKKCHHFAFKTHKLSIYMTMFWDLRLKKSNCHSDYALSLVKAHDQPTKELIKLQQVLGLSIGVVIHCCLESSDTTHY